MPLLHQTLWFKKSNLSVLFRTPRLTPSCCSLLSLSFCTVVQPVDCSPFPISLFLCTVYFICIYIPTVGASPAVFMVQKTSSQIFFGNRRAVYHFIKRKSTTSQVNITDSRGHLPHTLNTKSQKLHGLERKKYTTKQEQGSLGPKHLGAVSRWPHEKFIEFRSTGHAT